MCGGCDYLVAGYSEKGNFQRQLGIQVHRLARLQNSSNKIPDTRTMDWRRYQQESGETEGEKGRYKKNEYFGNLPSPESLRQPWLVRLTQA